MTKQDKLAAKFHRYAQEGRGQWKLSTPFAKFFAEWLRRIDLKRFDKYDFSEIEPYLPQLVVDAWEDLRTGTDEFTRNARETFGQPVYNFTNLGAAPVLEQGTPQLLGFLLTDVMKDDGRAARALEMYAWGERNTLQLAFDKFLRLVYRRGLRELIDVSSRSMSGMFAGTSLRSYTMAGRLMFTFARRKTGETVVKLRGEEVTRFPYEESTVTFIADDSDPLGLSAGLHSFEADDLAEALAMINDLIKYWPVERPQQEKFFHADDEVSMA